MTRDDTNADLHLTGNLMTSLVYADVIGVGTPRSDILHDYTYMEQHWYFMSNYGESYTGYWASHEHGQHSTSI